MANQAIELIAVAQRPDGYINSYVQTREVFEPWTDLDNGHELYCAGHLFQAAIAFQRALGDDRLLKLPVVLPTILIQFLARIKDKELADIQKLKWRWSSCTD